MPLHMPYGEQPNYRFSRKTHLNPLVWRPYRTRFRTMEPERSRKLNRTTNTCFSTQCTLPDDTSLCPVPFPFGPLAVALPLLFISTSLLSLTPSWSRSTVHKMTSSIDVSATTTEDVTGHSQQQQQQQLRLLDNVQSLVDLERSLTATIERAAPYLPGGKVRPLPSTMEEVEQVLCLARSLSSRTSAPAGWNPQAPVMGFATPNPLPHQLRGGALGALQLELARTAKLTEQQQAREAAEQEKKKRKLQQDEEEEAAKRKQASNDGGESEEQRQLREKQRRARQAQQQQQQQQRLVADMNLSDSSSSSSSEEEDDGDDESE